MSLNTQLEGLESLIDINKLLDKKAQEQGIVFSTMEKANRVRGAVSTGVLSFDLIMGGGYAPGTFSYIYGQTGSCKSTLLYHTTKEAIQKNMIACYLDHESSADPTYLSKIGIQLAKVCGFRNKRGEWEETPKLRYTVPTIAEDTFRFMQGIMKELPDKVSIKDPKTDEAHYFLIDPEYKYQLSWASINKGLKEEKVVEVENGSPQIIFIVDSLRAMLPSARDLDPEKDPLALQARMFAMSFPLVKSYLGKKNCLFVATNHLTINPMAMAQHKSPENEPGGTAVQFYPDMKWKMYINRAKSKIVEEPHVSGKGLDRYLNGRATIVKNKFGASFKEMSFRLWLDERGEPGRGIDPVWDMYMFLTCTNLLEEGENKKGEDTYKILIEGFTNEPLTWPQFKALVLGEEGERLREHCKTMLNSGTAQEAYYEYLRLQDEEVEEEEEEEEDDDDDDEDDKVKEV